VAAAIPQVVAVPQVAAAIPQVAAAAQVVAVPQVAAAAQVPENTPKPAHKDYVRAESKKREFVKIRSKSEMRKDAIKVRNTVVKLLVTCDLEYRQAVEDLRRLGGMNEFYKEAERSMHRESQNIRRSSSNTNESRYSRTSRPSSARSAAKMSLSTEELASSFKLVGKKGKTKSDITLPRLYETRHLLDNDPMYEHNRRRLMNDIAGSQGQMPLKTTEFKVRDTSQYSVGQRYSEGGVMGTIISIEPYANGAGLGSVVVMRG
jgi:hypothetical protein